MDSSDIKPRIFLSYARLDGEDFARDVRIKLEAEGFSVWQDRTQLEGGQDWWEQIKKALDGAEYMVLIATPAAMTSKNVQDEWRYARQQGTCICPLQVPGKSVDFDSLPRWISNMHFYNPDHEWETFIQYLKNPCQTPLVPFMAKALPDGYVSRPNEFESLLNHLRDKDHQNPIAITTALQGGGGFGKTTLAQALCHDNDIQTVFDDGILWVTLGQEPDIKREITRLYQALTGDDKRNFLDIDDASNNLTAQLLDKDCLIVIDDVWNINHVRPFLNGGKRCARLITTRKVDVAVGANARNVNVDEMKLDEAVQMLVNYFEPRPTNLEPFRALAKRLGEWPLMLEIANANLRQRMYQTHEDIETALAYLNKALDERGVVQVLKTTDEDTRRQSAEATISVSLDLFKETERTCYFNLGIFPEDIDIPLWVISLLWGFDEYHTEELILQLGNLSLLKYTAKEKTVRLHDIIRSYLVSQVVNPAELHTKLLNEFGSPQDFPLENTYLWRWYPYHLAESRQDERLENVVVSLAPSTETTGLRAILLTDLLTEAMIYYGQHNPVFVEQLCHKLLFTEYRSLSQRLLRRPYGYNFAVSAASSLNLLEVLKQCTRHHQEDIRNSALYAAYTTYQHNPETSIEILKYVIRRVRRGIFVNFTALYSASLLSLLLVMSYYDSENGPAVRAEIFSTWKSVIGLLNKTSQKNYVLSKVIQFFLTIVLWLFVRYIKAQAKIMLMRYESGAEASGMVSLHDLEAAFPVPVEAAPHLEVMVQHYLYAYNNLEMRIEDLKPHLQAIFLSENPRVRKNVAVALIFFASMLPWLRRDPVGISQIMREMFEIGKTGPDALMQQPTPLMMILVMAHASCRRPTEREEIDIIMDNYGSIVYDFEYLWRSRAYGLKSVYRWEETRNYLSLYYYFYASVDSPYLKKYIDLLVKREDVTKMLHIIGKSLTGSGGLVKMDSNPVKSPYPLRYLLDQMLKALYRLEKVSPETFDKEIINAFVHQRHLDQKGTDELLESQPKTLLADVTRQHILTTRYYPYIGPVLATVVSFFASLAAYTDDPTGREFYAKLWKHMITAQSMTDGIIRFAREYIG